MYICLKRNIETGVNDLPDVRQRIQDFCAGGFITVDQMNELLILAEQKANGIGSSEIPAQIESIFKRLNVIENTLTEILPMLSSINDGDVGNKEIIPILKDPTNLPAYTDGMIAPNNSIWIFDGKVYKSCSGDYGLAWGPVVLPQYWEDISGEYDLSKLMTVPDDNTENVDMSTE